MSKLSVLPPKQALFVQEYLKDFNGTQAAIRAKYSAKSAYAASSRLLKDMRVKAYLSELQAKVEEQAIMGINEVLTELKGIAEENRQNRPMVSVRAYELIGRSNGAFEPDRANDDEKLAFVGIEITAGDRPTVLLTGSNPITTPELAQNS